ncbi:hypothetical protein DFH09DRAFT_1396617 [Mycena vulgaris]|nr:hypothetical protein DFH09DRAFT_1396617 [Mycena vulgaris]
MFALIGKFVTSIGIVREATQWEPRLRGALFYEESKPWTATGCILSFLTTAYSTAFIAFRISRVNSVKIASQSRLMSFLSILVESAALQTLWLGFTTITQLASSDTAFIASDTFPVIIGIANLLIHARVELGWSQDSAASKKVQFTAKHTNEDVVWFSFGDNTMSPFVQFLPLTNEWESSQDFIRVHQQTIAKNPPELAPADLIRVFNGPSASTTGRFTAGTLAAASTNSSTVAKYAPIIIGLLGANLVILLVPVCLGVMAFVQRGRQTGLARTPVARYIPARVKDDALLAPSFDEKRYSDN